MALVQERIEGHFNMSNSTNLCYSEDRMMKS